MTRGIRVKNTDDIQKINKIVTRYGLIFGFTARAVW